MAAKVSYETDTGNGWYLDKGPASHTGPYVHYGDAGIVYDLGPASQFTGITYSGTGTLGANVWIAKQGVASDANSKFGEYHEFATDPVDFAYGFGTADPAHPGQVAEFWMMTDPYKPADLYQTLSAEQIAAYGDGYEVYAWVGISGDAPQSSHVDAIPGVHNAANLTLTVTGETITASAR